MFLEIHEPINEMLLKNIVFPHCPRHSIPAEGIFCPNKAFLWTYAEAGPLLSVPNKWHNLVLTGTHLVNVSVQVSQNCLFANSKTWPKLQQC